MHSHCYTGLGVMSRAHLITNCEHVDLPHKSLGLCKDCYYRQHRAANRDEQNRKSREFKRTWRAANGDRNKTQNVLLKAKQRAQKLGLPFNLTEENLPPVPEKCPVLGITITRGNQVIRSHLSLDRTSPVKGYVVGNVRWVSHRANALKSDASVFELERVLMDLRLIQDI